MSRAEGTGKESFIVLGGRDRIKCQVECIDVLQNGGARTEATVFHDIPKSFNALTRAMANFEAVCIEIAGEPRFIGRIEVCRETHDRPPYPLHCLQLKMSGQALYMKEESE